ncbi:MAG: GTP 3',8-cyclase MoaA [Saprospiraceae bacterium]|nr:GTP 3',8-cyclase MoaA [Saprospiraceae bacterium]
MLTDQFNRNHNYLRISLTDKCNLRCTYCNPVDLPKGYFSNCNKMTADEIDQIASVFIRLGVNKIRLTGGEPLVRKDAKDIIRRLSKYSIEITITTNGVFIHEFLDVFQQAGIKSVNVSLDSLNRSKNKLITGRDEFDIVLQNIQLLLDHGFQVKINTVVMKGINDSEILEFVEWTKNTALQVRFIEFMPFKGNHWMDKDIFSHDEMLHLIASQFEFDTLFNDKHDTARKYKVRGYQGTFAIISTMTKPFCNGCNRMRLTTDGKMKNCLFSQTEVDILSALRRQEDIVPLIKQCIWDKHESLGGQLNNQDLLDDTSKIQNRSMIHIGG